MNSLLVIWGTGDASINASQPSVPGPAPQGTPEALPYPILRRLSSTSHSRAVLRRAAPPYCAV